MVVALPEDMLLEEADVKDAAPVRPARSSPSAEDLARLREFLVASERPLVIVGEGGWTPATGADVLAFCEANSCRSRARSAARTSSTTDRDRTPASSASRWTTGWPAAPRSRPPPRDRRQARRRDDEALHAAGRPAAAAEARPRPPGSGRARPAVRDGPGDPRRRHRARRPRLRRCRERGRRGSSGRGSAGRLPGKPPASTGFRGSRSTWGT